MTRLSDARSDRCREQSCNDWLAARVFGGLGPAGVGALAAWAEHFHRTAGRRAAAGRCRPAGEIAIFSVPEVSLSEALSDPIVRTLMAADGVDPAELQERLDEVAKRLAGRRAAVAR